MYTNDESSKINAQVYERQQVLTNTNASEPDDGSERLSRQESYELREEICKYVPTFLRIEEKDGRQGRITVSQITQKFERCKEGFARDQLNKMVEEGTLISRQINGMKIYFLFDTNFQPEPDDSESSAQAMIKTPSDEPILKQPEAENSQLEIMAELLVKAINKISELEARLSSLENKPALTIKNKLDRKSLLEKLAQNS